MPANCSSGFAWPWKAVSKAIAANVPIAGRQEGARFIKYMRTPASGNGSVPSSVQREAQAGQRHRPVRSQPP